MGEIKNRSHQGTVLDPLLFLCYINDLLSRVASTGLLADDCLLYRPIENVGSLYELQGDLTMIQEWTNTWGMCFKLML